MNNIFNLPEFPRSSKYNPDWIKAGVSGGANPLWLTEWLSRGLNLKSGMKVLDLGCGRALSSIFLQREYDLEVWAVDLWCSVTENSHRIQDAGLEKVVFPIHADARSLPFAFEFFDAIISIDSFYYYGTDDLYLNYLAQFVKPGGQIGIAGAGLIKEFEGNIPKNLSEWWTADLWCLHSADWWRNKWERTAIVEVEISDTYSEGWRLWRDWHLEIVPDNLIEITALEADKGEYLGYVRQIGRRNLGIQLDDPILSIPYQYSKNNLLKSK